MRILVCGSRNFTDLALMLKTFREMFDTDDTLTLIHGNAKGADQLSEEVFNQLFRSVDVQRYPADWKKYGKAAGPIRNKQMLDEGKPDMVIAFLAPHSKGTKNMIEQATKAGIPVKIIEV